MKLKDYARRQGVSYRIVWRWWKAGTLPGRQMDTGAILIEMEPVGARPVVQRVAIYARVSSAENRITLDSQAERLGAYCAARGYQIARVVKEVGSGVNDVRPKRLALLEDQSDALIVGEHKDRLARFGFRYLDTLLNAQGRAIEIVNQAENGTENGTENMLADLTALVYSCCTRLYGQRRAQRKTEAIVRGVREFAAKGDGSVPDAAG